jgi:hypothetical protein
VLGTGAGDEHQREVAEDRAAEVISIGRRRVAAASRSASSLEQALLLQRVGELDDQDAVLGDQPDQRDQPDLRVDVDRGEVEVGEDQRAGDRQRHRAQSTISGSRKLLNWAASTR